MEPPPPPPLPPANGVGWTKEIIDNNDNIDLTTPSEVFESSALDASKEVDNKNDVPIDDTTNNKESRKAKKKKKKKEFSIEPEYVTYESTRHKKKHIHKSTKSRTLEHPKSGKKDKTNESSESADETTKPTNNQPSSNQVVPQIYGAYGNMQGMIPAPIYYNGLPPMMAPPPPMLDQTYYNQMQMYANYGGAPVYMPPSMVSNAESGGKPNESQLKTEQKEKILKIFVKSLVIFLNFILLLLALVTFMNYSKDWKSDGVKYSMQFIINESKLLGILSPAFSFWFLGLLALATSLLGIVMIMKEINARLCLTYLSILIAIIILMPWFWSNNVEIQQKMSKNVTSRYCSRVNVCVGYFHHPSSSLWDLQQSEKCYSNHQYSGKDNNTNLECYFEENN